MDEIFLYRFGLALKNLGHLLRDRQYETPQNYFYSSNEYEIVGLVYAAAKESHISLAEVIRCTLTNTSGHKISIWAFDRNYDQVKGRDRMISTEQVKYLGDKIRTIESDHLVLSPIKLSPQAKKEISSNVELFLFEDLLINIPKHNLVFKHLKVTQEEMESVLGPIKASDLPIIPINDPMTKWHVWPKGTIIFIDNPVMKSFRIVT